MVNAGVIEEIEELPEEWPDDFNTFHSPEWWRHHWTLSRCVEVECAENMVDGREAWLEWNRSINATDDEYLTSKAGENLGFHRVVARKY